jgi:predicted MPP superfamily phosphohydrolase
MRNKKNIILLVLASLLTVTSLFGAWIAWANTAIARTDYTVTSERLPAAFEGFRIAQVADLHCAEYDEGNQKLLSMLKTAKPDIIVFTGDTFDERHANQAPTLDFLRACTEIAPCYFITGNHECAMNRQNYFALEKQISEIGVSVLHAKAVEIARGDASITLLGVDDENYEGVLHSPEQLRELAGTDGFAILLSHRPEYFWRYAESGLDLTLSGHAHGGQFRLPLIGGLYAPGQGAFPEYDSGVYTYRNTHMIVSRGIGQSSFPLRFNNRPELLIITLGGTDK